MLRYAMASERRTRRLATLSAKLSTYANGELQSVSDPAHLEAASGCFGLMGVVTDLTLELDERSKMREGGFNVLSTALHESLILPTANDKLPLTDKSSR